MLKKKCSEHARYVCCIAGDAHLWDGKSIIP
nr:MAG TPA: hypothetical protein [Caudoviricetes sp.]